MSYVITDGKREIRTSPDQQNMTLHQIKQWAISTLDLPADHYVLRYQRKLLDPSLPCRLAGLPNAARIEILSIQMLGPKEILELKAARERPVGVTLGLPGGQQVSGKFKGDISLLAVLRHFESDSFKVLLTAEDGSTHSPVLQMGTERIFGLKRFSSTCLYDCGLGGNAKIQVAAYESCAPEDASISRLVSRPVETIHDQTEAKAKAMNDVPKMVEEPVAELDYDMDMVVIEAPSNHVSPVPDLPEDFYNLTPAEYKYFQSSTSHSLNQLRDRPFLSKSALERAGERKVLEAHPFTRIRFRFPDHTCIERNFRTTESASAMMNWIRTGLSRHSVPEFSLSIGPPAGTLKPHDTLVGLQLYPAAIVNVIWLDRTGVRTISLLGNTRDTGHPAAKRVSSPTIAHDVDNHQQSSEQVTASKVPKWLKLHK